MKAITLASIGTVELAERPEPRLERPGDALVRVTTGQRGTPVSGSQLISLESNIY